MMEPKLRALLERCIDDGISHGFARAHKHTDKPSEQLIAEEIQREIWDEIDEWFDFPEPPA